MLSCHNQLVPGSTIPTSLQLAVYLPDRNIAGFFYELFHVFFHLVCKGFKPYMPYAVLRMAQIGMKNNLLYNNAF